MADDALGYVQQVVATPDPDDDEDRDEVEARAHAWMAGDRLLAVGDDVLTDEQVRVIESGVAPVDMTLGDVAVTAGTWFIGVEVYDPELWERIEDGELVRFDVLEPDDEDEDGDDDDADDPDDRDEDEG